MSCSTTSNYFDPSRRWGCRRKDSKKRVRSRDIKCFATTLLLITASSVRTLVNAASTRGSSNSAEQARQIYKARHSSVSSIKQQASQQQRQKQPMQLQSHDQAQAQPQQLEVHETGGAVRFSSAAIMKSSQSSANQDPGSQNHYIETYQGDPRSSATLVVQPANLMGNGVNVAATALNGSEKHFEYFEGDERPVNAVRTMTNQLAQEEQALQTQTVDGMTLVLIPKNSALPQGSVVLGDNYLIENLYSPSDSSNGESKNDALQRTGPGEPLPLSTSTDKTKQNGQGEPILSKQLQGQQIMSISAVEKLKKSEKVQQHKSGVRQRTEGAASDNFSSSSSYVVEEPKTQLSFEDIRNKIEINPGDWQNMNPQAKDQMVIVSTVASMALLVGAISARKLRTRHSAAGGFLSSCIENDMEEDLAYDTATTTHSAVMAGAAGGNYGTVMGGGGGGPGSIANGAGGGGYDTFSQVSNGWRGDLEKFDV